MRGLTLFRVASFLTLAIFLCALYAIGPDVQQVAASLLKSSTPGIYRSLYGNGVITFPSLLDWLQEKDYWYYMIASVLTVAVVWRHTTVRRMALATYITTTLMLIAIDAAFAAYFGSLLSLSMLANVLFDIIGGILMACTIILVVRFMDLLFADAPAYGIANKSLTLLCPIFFALMTMLCFYFIERLLYSPRNVQFTAMVTVPVHGAIITHAAKSSSPNSNKSDSGGIFSKRQFSFIRDLKKYDLVTWLGDGVKTVKLIPSQTAYTVYIDFFSGCSRANLNKMPRIANQTIKLGVVNNISLQFGSGFTTFAMTKSNGNVSLAPNGVSLYSLMPSSAGSAKALDVSEFVGNHAIIHAGDEYSEVDFYLIANLFTSTKDNKVILSNRSLSVIADGIKHVFRFSNAKFRMDETVTCRSIPAQEVERARVNEVNATATAYVRLIPNSIDISNAQFDNIGVLEISGPAGWVGADNVPFSSFENFFQNDGVDFVTFSGAVKSLIVDSVDIDPSQYTTYQMFGHDIRGSIDDNGMVTFAGAAQAAWSGDVRFNATWWESLDWKIKSGIFSGATILLIFIAKLLRSIIIGDRSIRFLGGTESGA